MPHEVLFPGFCDIIVYSMGMWSIKSAEGLGMRHVVNKVCRRPGNEACGQ